MEDILETARWYRDLSHARMEAHYISSEWHRARGAKYGVAATFLSTVVSSSIFVTVANQIGINSGELSIVMPATPSGWIAIMVIGILLIVSPALTAVTTYLNDPDQAQRHNVSSSRYLGTKEYLDLFILKYVKPDMANNREQALEEFQSILEKVEEIANDSITLTDNAIKDACTRTGIVFSKIMKPDQASPTESNKLRGIFARQ